MTIMNIGLLLMIVAVVNAAPPLVAPGGLAPKDTPQFVMISFDGAVNIVNYHETFVRLFQKKNKHNQCAIQSNYFVSHEDSNYQLVNDLWNRGNEIASHTITHQFGTIYWKEDNYSRWDAEVQGQRKLISKFAQIPINEILGFRAPFLQTNGNTAFQVLKDNGFKYDSSMATLTYSKPHPAFPYSLVDGFRQDCPTHPCPTHKWHDLWIVPMNDYWRDRIVDDGPPVLIQPSPCAMVDSCLPFPEDRANTTAYYKDNFKRFYKTNKAPFPMFHQESWFQLNPARREGFLDFIDYLNTLDDVFIVTIQEVLKWMEKPVPLKDYKQSNCVDMSKLKPVKCEAPGTTCPYKHLPLFQNNDKSFVICGDQCPNSYPWVGNPLGA